MEIFQRVQRPWDAVSAGKALGLQAWRFTILSVPRSSMMPSLWGTRRRRTEKSLPRFPCRICKWSRPKPSGPIVNFNSSINGPWGFTDKSPCRNASIASASLYPNSSKNTLKTASWSTDSWILPQKSKRFVNNKLSSPKLYFVTFVADSMAFLV